jgi:hypothetical protein
LPQEPQPARKSAMRGRTEKERVHMAPDINVEPATAARWRLLFPGSGFF